MTDFIFVNDRMVGWSIASTYLIVAPLAALLFLFSAKPMCDVPPS